MIPTANNTADRVVPLNALKSIYNILTRVPNKKISPAALRSRFLMAIPITKINEEYASNKKVYGITRSARAISSMVMPRLNPVHIEK